MWKSVSPQQQRLTGTGRTASTTWGDRGWRHLPQATEGQRAGWVHRTTLEITWKTRSCQRSSRGTRTSRTPGPDKPECTAEAHPNHGQPQRDMETTRAQKALSRIAQALSALTRSGTPGCVSRAKPPPTGSRQAGLHRRTRTRGVVTSAQGNGTEDRSGRVARLGAAQDRAGALGTRVLGAPGHSTGHGGQQATDWWLG